MVAAQLSGLTVQVLDLFSEGDRVAARIQFDGVHTGECMGIPATGKRLRFEALEHFRVKDGRIAESWGYWPDKEIEEKLR
ncbi:MAG: ester cyclase [Eubacteriales bacterium]|nr:ester cyclase [Eubacteriales bacterium]